MANRLPQPIIVCIAVNAAGDPDITGTPLVLRYKCPIDWFPVNPPATVTDPITGVVSPYVGAVFDPNFVWYTYEVPSAPDPVDHHTPTFKVVCTRTYVFGTLIGKLAIVWCDFWPNNVPTAAAGLLTQFAQAGKLAILSASVLTANEAKIQIA
jgi:hypothetical protein